MPEDLNKYVEQRPDGSTKLRPGVSHLPPMPTAKQIGPATRPAETRPESPPKNDPKRKAADRFAVLNSFVDVTMAGLTRSEMAVWMVLYRDTKNGTVSTSQENIARRAGTSVRHVRKAIASLIAAKLLTVLFQGGLNLGPSRYRVNPLGTRRS